MHTKKRGQWIFLVKRGHKSDIQNYLLQNLIPTLEGPKNILCDGIDAEVAGSMIGPTVVSTYSDVLKNQLDQEMDTTVADTPKQSSHTNKCRQMIPIYANAKKDTSYKVKNTSNTKRTPSICTSTSSDISQMTNSAHFDVTARLQQFEKNWNRKCNKS